MPRAVHALTAPVDILPTDARLPGRHVPLHLPQRLRDPDLMVPAVLGLILLATAFEALMLVLEITLGGDDRPFHLLTLIGLVVIFIAVLASYRLLGLRIERLAQFSTRLETALRAKEAAEIANLAKARYLANVSHEIRSPLNAIYGYAQLVEQKADVRPHDAARVIRRCAEHMTSLVESLLDISRLENGLLRVRSEIVRLPDFLEQIVWMMRPAAEAKGLAFVHEPPARLPEFVRTDPSRLRQALINLIGNAIKFTDEGTVTLRIAYRGQVATLEIEDTGPGIALEDQGRIFDPYEQVAGSAGQARSGVGLGLPITKAIIEILGGNLELESEPGRGSCFRVTLMLSEPAHALDPEAPQRRIVGHEGPQRSILLVDDDPDQRDFLERFLTACGFEVVALPNGETAGDALRQSRLRPRRARHQPSGHFRLGNRRADPRDAGAGDPHRDGLGQCAGIPSARVSPADARPIPRQALSARQDGRGDRRAAAPVVEVGSRPESPGDAAEPGRAGLPRAAIPHVEQAARAHPDRPRARDRGRDRDARRYRARPRTVGERALRRA
jgi:signal transduction histidine kinase